MISLIRPYIQPAYMCRSFSSGWERRVVPLQPGLLTIKNGLSPGLQMSLSKIALGLGEKGFWRTDEMGQRVLNSAPHRGRIYDAVKSFPPIIAEAFQKNIDLAVKTDPTIRMVQATHLILLYYKTLPEAPAPGFIPWHQDNGENDGDEDFPVVSFNIGDSCDFLINNQKPKISLAHSFSDPENLAHRVHLESGDVLVFGGPSRYIWHAIHKMHEDTAPEFLPFKGARLNFTFRYTPKILGKEADFATKPGAELPRDNPFFKLSKMK